MHEFTVPTMTCGHCAGAIKKAVAAVDPGASVNIDLVGKRVSISSSQPSTELVAAIREAGYEPSPAA